MRRRLTSSLRQHRGLSAAHPVLWLTLGVLFAGQLPGEPLHSRLFLVLMVVLAIATGIVYEGTRPGGTLDLLEQLAALEPDRVVVTLDVDGYVAGELATAVADGALVLSRRRP